MKKILAVMMVCGIVGAHVDSAACESKKVASAFKKGAAPTAVPTLIPPTPKKADKKETPLGLGNALGGENIGKLPTLITSKTLDVDSEKRIFYYRTDVTVKQGDMTLTCQELEGHYNENNQIERLIAKKNVIMIKAEKMKASSERGVYDANTAIITMTENPKLEQNSSVLQADLIKIFLNEDRSVAEGDVSVTVVNDKDAAAAPARQPAATMATPPVTPTPEPTRIPGVMNFGQ